MGREGGNGAVTDGGDKLGDRIARGKRAALLINDPIFDEAMTDIEEGIKDAWLATKDEEFAVRERCWKALILLGQIRQKLQAYVDGGRIAQGDLDRMLRDS